MGGRATINGSLEQVITTNDEMPEGSEVNLEKNFVVLMIVKVVEMVTPLMKCGNCK